MFKYKRYKIYAKYGLTPDLIRRCEAIYKFYKKNKFYYEPSNRYGKVLINKVLKEIL